MIKDRRQPGSIGHQKGHCYIFTVSVGIDVCRDSWRDRCGVCRQPITVQEGALSQHHVVAALHQYRGISRQVLEAASSRIAAVLPAQDRVSARLAFRSRQTNTVAIIGGCQQGSCLPPVPADLDSARKPAGHLILMLLPNTKRLSHFHAGHPASRSHSN